ncbi:MAG TPA: hypothetical protein VHR45_08360 [Thermoanaerobaculia bacterium]|nr:hypothetical protein [Thermoanaerobaculia bacterium]
MTASDRQFERAAGWRLRRLVAFGAMIAAGAAGVAQAETRIEKQLALDPGGHFTLDSDVGRVIVHGDSSAGARIVVTADRDDLERRYDLRFEAIPGGARVTARRHRAEGWSWFGWSGGFRGRVRFEVSVPKSTAVTVRTSGGGIEVAGLDGDTDLRSSGGAVAVEQVAGKVNARSSGGGVSVRDIRGDVRMESSGGGLHGIAVAGALTGETSGGRIELDRITGDIDVDTSGGGIRIEEAGARVKAVSSGGGVRVRFAAGNAKGGRLSSSGGGIDVWLDPAIGLDLDASSSGGSVVCDLPVTIQGRVSRSSLHGVLRGGGERLSVGTSGGGVRIAAR